jgi:hypothetical protein
MKRALALAFSTFAVVAGMSGAQADWSAGAGFENFRWKESTSPSVKENGLRWALDLGWIQSRELGLSAGYQLKLYTGNVDYTGATLIGNTPVSAETHYRGVNNEIQSFYRTPAVDFVLAAGWDHWTRKASAVQKETWDVGYARVGVSTSAAVKQGLLAGGGVKYTFYTRENAHLTDFGFTDNPRLRPGADWSLYGTLGYRVNADWDVLAFYDSYYFKQSNIVAPSGVGFLQPRSRQDVVGMKILRNF